ncbi:MAG: glycoside hydrolase family 3 N-terminal domain-containing protein [Paracoccaceae bacterium]
MGQGAYIFGCEGLRLKSDEKDFFKEAQPWGFILFARNVDTPDQLLQLCRDLRHSVGRDAPILIDQEGGRVERMRAPHWRQWLPPIDQVRLAGTGAARSMWLRYCLIASELQAVGIDCNCAPLADIATHETHAILANRCYGDGALAVTKIAREVADGMLFAGVLPVLKHMPGQGRAVSDSHDDLPVVGTSATELKATDFAVFAGLADLPMAMTNHIVYSALDDKPVTHSKQLISLIREQIEFQGLLMTDDISMQALQGTVAERSERALQAGCDIVLHCNGFLSEMQAIAQACGNMNSRAQDRAETALSLRSGCQDVDIPALETELADILGGSPYV